MKFPVLQGLLFLCIVSGKSHAETFDNIVKRVQVPRVFQTTDYTCGPASLLAVFKFFGVRGWTEAKIEKEAKTTSDFGTHHRELVKLSEAQGLKPRAAQKQTIADLEKAVDNGRPVIVAYQAALSDGTYWWADEWEQGHYAVVVGHSKDSLIFMDPLVADHYTYIPKREFVERWHDDDGDVKLINFAIYFERDDKFIRYDEKFLSRG